MKPDFFKDEDLATLPFEARLLFEGLWCYADRQGRLEDRPKYLKAEIFPYDNIDIENLLMMLASPKIEGREDKIFIRRYSVDGRKYIDIPEFLKHQSPHNTEKESLLPPFNGDIPVIDTLKNNGVQDAHSPKSINSKPKSIDSTLKPKKQKLSLPDDFIVSDRVKKWATEKGYTKLEEHLESFKLKCRSNDYKYSDWDSAFMNAIRDNWAKIGNGNGGSPPREPPSSFTSCPACGEYILKSQLYENGCIFCVINGAKNGQQSNAT